MRLSRLGITIQTRRRGFARKGMFAWGLALGLVLGLVGAAAPASAAQTLITAHNSPPGGPHSIGVNAFAAELDHRLPGRFQVDSEGGVQAGAEPDIWDGVRLGSIDVAVITTISLSKDVPEVGLLDIPLLFRDKAHARQTLDGPIGRELAEKINQQGVEVLAWGELGFRQLTTSTIPLRTPGDLAGLKIRVVPNPIYRETIQTLGATPVEMFLPKLYTALRQGTVDGEDNPILVFEANHLDDVQHYLSMTGLFYNPLVFMMNRDDFKRLSAEERDVVRAAAAAGAAATRENNDLGEARALAAMRGRGLVVNETIDRDAFLQALAPLRARLADRFGSDLAHRIDVSPGTPVAATGTTHGR